MSETAPKEKPPGLMTERELRQWYAGQAVQGLVAHREIGPFDRSRVDSWRVVSWAEEIARNAWAVADAMIKLEDKK